MTCSQEKLKRGFSPAVQVKCVVCGHKETVPLTKEMPACTQCLGPVVTEVSRLAILEGYA